MDGNGRWARRRGLPRSAGHRAGAAAVRRVVEAAPRLGVGTLTLYAFSADNWQRPASEVDELMRLFREHLDHESERCSESGVRLNVIGRRDRLAPALVAAIERAESATRDGERLHLRLAVDYSARQSIVAAAAALEERGSDTARFEAVLNRVLRSDPPAPPVDLLVRSGGERRLSDFMLWECAYAELLFVERPWPEFGAADLEAALADYRRRRRTFGRIVGSA